MTREQAEKLRAEKRRKLLHKKRIKAFAMLFVIVAVVAGLAFAAIKGIGYLDSGSESGTDIVSESIVTAESDTTDESEDSNGKAVSESTDESVSSEEAVFSEDIVSSEETAQKPEHSWSTMLVNQWSYMPEGYVPEVRAINYQGVSPANNKFDVRAADALELMLADARAAGYNMYLVSAYRSHEYQIGLYNRKVNEYLNAGYDEATAKSEASQWVAIPGTSEHCIGLAADIVSSTWYNYNSDLTHDFENTEHFKWLYENCADYGFILRYPKGKESITAITYEPWHYRYVGVDAAKYIMENNLTLEEFHAQ